MSPDDLWIGDRVRLIKSGTVGFYEGMNKKGKARIRVEEKILLTSHDNLLIENAPEPPPKVDLTDQVKYTPSTPAYEIDLHIEILDPKMEQAPPEQILLKQIRACTDFLENAVGQRFSFVRIIHGLGTGQLKREVEHILAGIEEVRTTSLVNNGGATDVSFTYN